MNDLPYVVVDENFRVFTPRFATQEEAEAAAEKEASANHTKVYTVMLAICSKTAKMVVHTEKHGN